MKFIFVVLMIVVAGWAFGYIRIGPERASVDMGSFDLKIPKDKKKET